MRWGPSVAQAPWHLLLLLALLLAACAPAAPVEPHNTASRLLAASTLEQVGPVDTPLNDPPTVRVLGGDGRGLGGVPVTFVASEGSVVEPAMVTTDGNGYASVAGWRPGLGAAELRATVAEAEIAPVVFRAEGVPRGFDLELRWLTPRPVEATEAAAAAEAILEAIIYGDLPDESVEATPVCPLGGSGPVASLDEVVDDVLVLAAFGPIDGPGGAGAQGFPCLIRDPGTQTVVGFIRLDEADFGQLTPQLRREFVLHEMVHALGLVPQLLNITTPTGFTRSCLALPSTGLPTPLVQDSHFSCANARAAFDRVGGLRYAGAKVPLENGATRPLGSNTLNHHWRKSSLRNELMTGWFVFGVPGPLSIVTAGALADLGYAVSYAGAEPFVLDGEIATAPALAPGTVVELVEPAVPPVAILRPARRR